MYDLSLEAAAQITKKAEGLINETKRLPEPIQKIECRFSRRPENYTNATLQFRVIGTIGRYFTTTEGGSLLVHVAIQSNISNCGILSWNTIEYQPYVPHKLTVELLKLFLLACLKPMGYTQIHWTGQVRGQAPMINILKELGFKEATDLKFKNRRSEVTLCFLYFNHDFLK